MIFRGTWGQLTPIPGSPGTLPGYTPKCFTCVYSSCDAVESPVFIAAAGAEIQMQTAATSNSRSPGNHKVLTRELQRDAGLFDLFSGGPFFFFSFFKISSHVEGEEYLFTRPRRF